MGESAEERFSNTDMLSLDVHTFDPEPLYAWLRDERPLFWDAINEIWAVSRYEDVLYVSRQTDLFCNGKGVVPNLGTDVWPDEAMINLDGQEHTCQRGLVSKGFSPRRIAQMEDRVRELAHAYVDKIAPAGKADLVTDIARPLPFWIIADMLGYPEDKRSDILGWTDIYSHAGCGPATVTEEVADAFSNFTMFHFELLEEKKACRGDDLLSVWLDAEIDGERLSEDKLMYEHNLLLVGGSETTRSAISLGMQELMRHPKQMAWLREHLEDSDALNTAVEEMIRWSTPFVRMRRTATQDVEMHGQTILEDQQIIMLYPAANFDPRVFETPERFDIRRKPNQPALSFGIGKHFCLGAALARLETRIVVETLLQRLPDLRPDPDAEPVRHRSCFVRSLHHLPVVFSPS